MRTILSIRGGGRAAAGWTRCERKRFFESDARSRTVGSVTAVSMKENDSVDDKKNSAMASTAAPALLCPAAASIATASMGLQRAELVQPRGERRDRERTGTCFQKQS